MRHFTIAFVLTLSFFLTAFKVADVITQESSVLEITKKPIELKPINVSLIIETENIVVKNHDAFLDKMGHYESSNDYTRVNRLGYMGKYQFHKKTLKSIGIKTTRTDFLNNPKLQEEAMKRLLMANKKTLRRFIKKYNNKSLHGVYVTESGLLAAAHLGGAGNVIDWIRHGDDFKDANGTPITRYMKNFSGYTLNLN